MYRLLILALAILSFSGFCVESGLANESAVKHFVQFVGRKSETVDGEGEKFPGHAYIRWVTVKDNKGMSEQTFEAVGFYPKQASFRCAVLKDESEESYRGVWIYQVEVDEKTFAASYSDAEAYSKMADEKRINYALFTTNCVGFVDVDAKSVSLDRPDAEDKLPWIYVQQLKSLNSKRK